MNQVFRPNETVYDKVTKEYYKVETVKTLKMWGTPRTYYKLKNAPGTRPEDSWRELDELTKSATLSPYLAELLG